ncbi:peptidase M17 [bacterium]|nr:peptidase M17 [bacterium]
MIALSNEAFEQGADYEVYVFEKDAELAKLPLGRTRRQWVRSQFEAAERQWMELTDGDRRIAVWKTKSTGTLPAALEEARVMGLQMYKRAASALSHRMQLLSLSKKFALEACAEGLWLGSYRFDRYLSKAPTSAPGKVSVPGLDDAVLHALSALVRSVFEARDLINEPVSALNAEKLASEAVRIGKEAGFKVEVLNKKKIESLKMGGILAVNQGSIDPPTFSILEWNPKGAKNEKPLVVVGKGVVYDTGGLSLKPTPGSMDSMKCDMSGAAAVIGLFALAARTQLPYKLVGLIPASDNRPGGNAYAPGDIVRMYDGTTIEVMNTDAEGRMLLADALSYAKKYDPELVIDLATLTGSASNAIGKNGMVGMGNAPAKVMDALVESGARVYERIAVFPFWDDYAEMLKSPIADMKNIGGKTAGAITAGKFLEHFTDYPYIHLDIAGPAFLEADDHYRVRGGTGVGIRLLYDFLKNRA